MRIGKQSAIVLFLIVLLSALTNIGIFKYITWPPAGPHQWAQCDRGSVARNFADRSMNILLPRTHNISNDTGIGGMEFPLVNWIVALLYKVFGFHEGIYRAVMFSLFLLALILAFNICLHSASGNFFFALFPVLFFSLSPVLCYYAANFIPDMASLAFIMAGWYLFFLADLRLKRAWFFLALWLSLACLIKITAGIHVIAMVIVFVADAVFWNKELRRQLIKMAGAVCVVAITSILWYRYARWLNTTYHGNVFLMDMRPVSSFSELKDIFLQVRNGVSKEYYAAGYLWFLVFINAIICIRYRLADKKLVLATVLLYAGAAGYFVLMAKQFLDHDYYVITLTPAILFNLVLFFQVLQRILDQKLVLQIAVIAVSFGFANYLMVTCKKNIRNRYAINKWHNYLATPDLYGEEACLDKMGVGKDQKIIFYPDPSANISLYLLNRRGVPVSEGNEELLAKWIRKGSFDYLLIDHHGEPNALSEFSLVKKGNCNNISIFKLHD